MAAGGGGGPRPSVHRFLRSGIPGLSFEYAPMGAEYDLLSYAVEDPTKVSCYADKSWVIAIKEPGKMVWVEAPRIARAKELLAAGAEEEIRGLFMETTFDVSPDIGFQKIFKVVVRGREAPCVIIRSFHKYGYGRLCGFYSYSRIKIEPGRVRTNPIRDDLVSDICKERRMEDFYGDHGVSIKFQRSIKIVDLIRVDGGHDPNIYSFRMILTDAKGTKHKILREDFGPVDVFELRIRGFGDTRDGKWWVIGTITKNELCRTWVATSEEPGAKFYSDSIEWPETFDNTDLKSPMARIDGRRYFKIRLDDLRTKMLLLELASGRRLPSSIVREIIHTT